ncbi:SET domain-containing protein [Tuber magnatum]|uniref:SET domain-containing protein n=1 Tax=Tuber magnatum TaxID=42249 RepID=A0A317SZE3_9PEZI|nr:SET domain-containing protein [Tuber magnatum]
MVYLPQFFNLSIPVNKAHPILPPEVEIRQTATKGYSLFAVSDIPAGTLLFAESPLVTINHDDTSLHVLVQKSLSAADPHSIRSFYNLHNAHHRWTYSSRTPTHGPAIEAGIWLTNCLLLSTSTSAIFNAMSRINHSCIPNVELEWSEDRELMGVFAKRDLAAGDEIFRSYFEEEVGHRLVEVRREYLKGGWAFECGCKRCVNEATYWSEKNKASASGENRVGIESGSRVQISI